MAPGTAGNEVTFGYPPAKTVPRPRIFLHNAVSLDEGITGFPVDLGLYYESAGHGMEEAASPDQYQKRRYQILGNRELRMRE